MNTNINIINSCGAILIHKKKFLIGLPNINQGWNIPKGVRESGESELKTAIREVKEESNIDISNKSIYTIGSYDYIRSTKILTLFAVYVDDSDVQTVKCNSMYKNVKDNKMYPEFIDFKWIYLIEYDTYFRGNMRSLFSENYKFFDYYINK